MGYYMVITLASLTSISDTFYEAAKVDGATKWDCLTKITLPLLKPTIIMNIFLSTISAMQVFDMVYTMTGGGPSMSTTTLSTVRISTHLQRKQSRIMLWPFPMY